MKSPCKFAVPMFLMLFAGLCFSQSAGKGPKAPSKPGAKAPAAAAKAPAAKAPAAKVPPKYAGPEEIPAARPDDIFPPVVAKVNGEPILGRDLEQLVRSELNAIGNPEWKNLRGDYRAELTLNKITLLINSKLLYQKAMASGQWATDGEVQSEIQKIARSYKSEAEMNADLAGQNRTRASLEKSLFENLTTSKYVEATINKKIVVTPEEAAKYYKSNLDNFRHPDVVRTGLILIKPADGTPEQDAAARQRAESLLARVNKGEDFAKLAREYSAHISASQGGDTGFNSRDAMIPELADAAFSLPVGSAKLIPIPQGYCILKITDKKKEGLFTLEDVKQQLMEYLASQKSQDEMMKLVNQLREKAAIEILVSSKDLLNP